MTRKRIAIVGGGAAGIAAAHTLLDAQGVTVDVHLFEAADGYGGRARTATISDDRFTGFNFDMGAQYVQDPEFNPWAYIARMLGHPLQEDELEGECWVKHEGVWTTENADELYDKIRDIEERLSQFYSANQHQVNVAVCPRPDSFDDQVTLLGYDSSEFKPLVESAEPWQYLASDRARQEKRHNQTPWFVPSVGVGGLVVQWGKSLQNFALDEPTDKLSGYTSYFQRRVTAISNTGQKLSISHLHTEAPSWHPAESTEVDACIVTVPVTQLRNIAFTPALPQRDVVAAEHVKLGSYKKLAFKLVPSSGSSIDFIAENKRYFLPDIRYRGVWQYYRTKFFPDGVFLAECAGDIARELDTLGIEAVQTHFRELFVSLFPGRLDIGNLIFGAMTNWSDTRYVQGAYSYTAPVGRASSRDPDNPDAFNARVQLGTSSPPLFFAGEALFTEQYGTIEGAYKTGQQAAQQVAALLRQLA